jgi:hypothetical protein
MVSGRQQWQNSHYKLGYQKTMQFIYSYGYYKIYPWIKQ